MKKVKLAISSCLLGDKVRYDGQHKLNLYLRDQLGAQVEYLKICAEVECGLPIPREPIHLAGEIHSPRLVTVKTQRDITDQMQNFIQSRLQELEREELDGMVFKKSSPSCGLERVKVFNCKGIPLRKGRGMFAAAFTKHFPNLPVIEEGMLNDNFLREQFLNRIFINRDWRILQSEPHSATALSAFQAQNKLLIMSHAANRYSELGRLVEDANYEKYFEKLNELLRLKPTVSKHTNVMMHMLGYFKRNIDSWEKQEVLEAITQYRAGQTQLAVPLTLLRHYARKYDCTYLLNQSYWSVLN